jgi:hypothetical protein
LVAAFFAGAFLSKALGSCSMIIFLLSVGSFADHL